MIKLNRWLSVWMIVTLLMVSLAPVGTGPAVEAQGIPEPFPEDCDDITPEGGLAPACCLYGYVYDGELPLDGASVRVESTRGFVDDTTGSGTVSAQPYYAVSLSDAPLLVSAGETITVTASHAGRITTRTWLVQENGQQVDLGLVTTRQARTIGAGAVPGPLPNAALKDTADEVSPGGGLLFVENQGQFEAEARFYAPAAANGGLWLAADGIWITLLEPGGPQDTLAPTDGPPQVDSLHLPQQGVNLKLSFVGANPTPQIVPLDRQETVFHYFRGNDPAGWRSGVRTWAGVRYLDLYPGVDLELRGQDGYLAWRFVVRDPAFDAGQVRLQVEGAQDLQVEAGYLGLSTTAGPFRLPLPRLEGIAPSALPELKEGDAGALEVARPFALPEAEVRTGSPALLAPADDPGDLVFSTVVGSSGNDYLNGIALDDAGNIITSGWTYSANFPTIAGGFDTSHNGNADACISALSADGTELLYSTFLGGSGEEIAWSVALDDAGNIFATGRTLSADFPATSGAFDTDYEGLREAFVVKLAAGGEDLLWGTFLGGSDMDGGITLVLDDSGNVVVTGYSRSPEFPTTPGAFDESHNGQADIFVSKVAADGSSLVYSTFIGGTNEESGRGLILDGTGNVVLTNWTMSSDFPTTPGAYDPTFNGGSEDGYLVKLKADGSGLLYSTYFGGAVSNDWGMDVVLDASGNAVIAGLTRSSDFPTTEGAYDRSHNGLNDVFVIALPFGGPPLHSTLVGGSGDDSALRLALDGTGDIIAVGNSFSANFPTTGGAYDTSHNGNCDAFALKLAAGAGSLLYSTFAGGSGLDVGYGLALDAAGHPILVGYAESTGFPTTAGAYDESHNGGADGYVLKLQMDVVADTTPPAAVADLAATSGVMGAVELAWTAPGDDGDSGTAWSYVVRYNTMPIDESNWASSTEVSGEPTPGRVGSAESMMVADLTPGQTYFFALKTMDEVPNTSAISNSPSAVAGNPAVEAAFSASPLSGPVPLLVQFTDLSTGPILTWDWDFGDGRRSGARHPAHLYTISGLYSVSLTVNGPSDFDTETKNGCVEVTGNRPTSSIEWIWPVVAQACPDTIISFHGGAHDNDADEGGAYIVAYEWLSDIDGWLSDQEDFSTVATALSLGRHTISFRAQDDEGEWSEPDTETLDVVNCPSSNTLILVNQQKLQSLYDSSQASLVLSRLNSLADHPDVQGEVIQVDSDPAVAAAYTAWDNDPSSTPKANAVTEAIKALVDGHWAAHPELKYLVIAGDDRVIPFRRVPDGTHHPESKYQYVTSNSSVGVALNDGMTLTDDFYADRVPTLPRARGWDGHALYLPDLGTGRLIETPSEIVAQIDAFLASGGLVGADDAAVTGYDFVVDAAQAICQQLRGDGLGTDCSLIGESWTRSQFLSKMLNSRHDLVSINGHANHYVLGTPSGGITGADVAAAAADHSGALWYSLGCHAGLNVPPQTSYGATDLPQAAVSRGISYVANTGYGWGFRTAMGLSEQLMVEFSKHLVYGQSATVGQALAAAKQEYYLNEISFDYYDEKILIESTLYGLPMLRYTTSTALRAQAGSPEPAVSPLKEEHRTVLGDGFTRSSYYHELPALLSESTDAGQYYTFGGWAHAADGEPIQPKFVADVSLPQTRAHGVVFLGGAYADEGAFDPVVERAITETASLDEPAFEAPTWYPPVLQQLNGLERGYRVVSLLGQYNPENQSERVYDQVSFDVYYHTTSNDWTAPSIPCVNSHLFAGTSQVTVRATDASGIHAVVIAYTDGNGLWQSISLTNRGGLWSGTFPATSTSQFFVQVVDQAGNVGVDDNLWRYFAPGEGSCHLVHLPLVTRNP